MIAIVANLQREHKKLVDEMEKIMQNAEAESRDLTEEEMDLFDKNSAKCAELEKGWRRHETVERLKSVAPAIRDINEDTILEQADRAGEEVQRGIVIPSSVYRSGVLRSFTGEKAEERAYQAGRWFMAIAGHAPSKQWCEDHNLPLKWMATQEEGVNTTGGYLVPQEIDRDIIVLRNLYGVFRRNCRVKPMAGDTLIRPRRTGGLTATFTGESEAATESSKSWDIVSLTARKLTALTRISNELREDSIISIADDLVSEIAYAFAKKEDECGFVGTGTLAYGGIKGVVQRIEDVCGVTAGGGLKLSTGTTQAATVLADIVALISVLPDYAEIGSKFYCTRLYFYAQMIRLLSAAGGNTIQSIQAGPNRNFLGYPVEFTNTLPTADAVSTIYLLFGDLYKAADYGDRRQNTIMFSEHASVGGESVFERDQMAVRGTERFDINVHDVGTATVAGPIVALMTTAS